MLFFFLFFSIALYVGLKQLFFQKSGEKNYPDFFYEWNQGLPNAAEGHVGPIPPVFALIRKDYKYFYWPHFDYEQVFHVEEDPFEEFDIFNSTAQTQPGIIEDLRARYAYLKNWSQSGNPV